MTDVTTQPTSVEADMLRALGATVEAARQERQTMTTQPTTLTDFLLTRIAEDEAIAESLRRPSAGDPWGWQNPRLATNDAHRVEYPPARVLAECEAKRRIVADHHPDDLCVAVLAAVYADHPDYREEWRP